MKETTETFRTEKQTKKASKKLNKAKVLLGSVVVVVILAYLLNSIINLIKNPTDTFIVREGKISKEEAAIGYIIREETVVKGENYKNGMEQIIDEGSRVAKGESIFRYYSSGENSLKEKIKALDIKIQETIENNNSNELVLADTRLLDSQIDQALSDINTLNNIQKIQETKKKLNTYISKKARIAGENSPSGSYLRKLIDERSKYENELNEINDKIVKLYAEVEEEIAIMGRMQGAINSKSDYNLISFNDLLSMIEKEVNLRKIVLNLKNKNAIYRYSDTDHSYILLDMNKKDNIFNTYLNETLTDVEMIKKNIEIID